MSFSHDIATEPGGAVRRMLRNDTLGNMAYAMGVAATAVAVTAGYQIAVEEGRNLLTRMRMTRSKRRERNYNVLCALISSEDMPIQAIEYLQGERDVFHSAIRLMLDPEVAQETRDALRSTLRRLYSAAHSPAG